MLAPNEVERLYDLSEIRSITKGNTVLLKKILQAFINEVSAAVTAIESAYEQNDLPTVQHYAHKIKANIDSLQIQPLARIVRTIEQAAKNNHPEPLAHEIQSFAAMASQVIEQIRAQELV